MTTPTTLPALAVPARHDLTRALRRSAGWMALAALLGTLLGCDDSPSEPATPVEVVLVETTPESFDLDVGDTLRVQAMPFDAQGRPLPNAPVRWVVGHADIVHVSNGGLVTARKAGQTFVRAIAGNAHGTSLVRVVDPSIPAPVVTQLHPAAVQAGSGAFQLVVRGSGFRVGSTILWGGDELTTTRVGDTELRAQVAARAVADAGTVEVRVSWNGVDSEPRTFTVTPAGGTGNAPVLQALNPSRIPAGSVDFTLTVTGSGFGPDATVFWNGQARTTERVSAGVLRASVTVGDVWVPGSAEVSVAPASAAQADGTLPAAALGAVASAPLNFTVDPSGVAQLEVTPDVATLEVGQSVAFQVRLLDAQGRELTGRHVSFTSENANLVSIDSDGIAVAHRSGMTRVGVFNSESRVRVEVTVSVPPVGMVHLTPGSTVLLADRQVTLAATAYATNGEQLSGLPVQWWSTDPSILTVDAAGVVTGRAPGTARVYAEIGGVTGWASLEVRRFPESPSWTFDLRFDLGQLLPVVGDTTWIDGAGVTHEARFILAAASFTLNRETRRWSQTMRWDVMEGVVKRGESIRTLEGPVLSDYLTGQPIFVTDANPNEVAARGRITELAELHLTQAVGTQPSTVYRYVIR